MNVTVPAGRRRGAVRVPASKSIAHRLVIAAALSSGEHRIACDGVSEDIRATLRCMRALGAHTEAGDGTLSVRGVDRAPSGTAVLDCGESGSTLRFLLPVVGAMGAEAEMRMAGRLPQRPLAPLDAELTAHGMALERAGDSLFCRGKLSAGEYTIPGNVSSQYVSGLLLALPLLEGDSSLTVTGEVESAGYIALTEAVLRDAGVRFSREGWRYRIPGGQRYALPEDTTVEGDWSSAAFFLCAGALSEAGVEVRGLRADSAQGDRGTVEALRAMGADVREREGSVLVRRGQLLGCTIDGSAIPDCVPVLAALAAAAEGETRIVRAGRLRLKESDRIRSTAELIRAIGGEVTETEDGMLVRGKASLPGGTVDAQGDHRIAMTAAVLAGACRGPVTVLRGECVAKSYPRFWEVLQTLEVEGR